MNLQTLQKKMFKRKNNNTFLLPADMWNEIFKFLNPLDIVCVIPGVCNSWRKSILNSYFHAYLKDHISFLNIKNIEELFNNIKLLQKYKRYLFRKYIQQKAHLFAHFSELFEGINSTLITSTYVINNNEKHFVEKEFADIQRYCNLFYLPNSTEPLILDKSNENNKTSLTNQQQQKQQQSQSSCYGFYSNTNTNNSTVVDNNIYLLKGIMLGDTGVGKTSFLMASIKKQFYQFVLTVGVDFQIKTHILGNNYPSFKLQLWDSIGSERFRSITRVNLYRRADGFFICFDLTDNDSFKRVTEWKEDIDDYGNNKAKQSEVILLGLKSDLIENRVVERKEVEKLEFEMELIYEEISSKEMNNVDSPTWYLVLMKYCFNQFKRI